jgi:hypothetical protein
MQKKPMEENVSNNVVNVLYYLYFGNRELVYYFERIWTKDGMRYHDEEYSYVFCGMYSPNFSVNLETYYFLQNNKIIEETGGGEHTVIYELAEYYRIMLTTILNEKLKENKTTALST